jgi:hypothetical protein
MSFRAESDRRHRFGIAAFFLPVIVKPPFDAVKKND